jgi:hypothetical protein
MRAYAAAQARKPRGVPEAGHPWNVFKLHIENLVGDCNQTAGEELWKIVRRGQSSGRLRICSKYDDADCVEMAFRIQSESIACKFGSTIGAAGLHLTLTHNPDRPFRCGDAELTVREAADLLLDQLIFPEN